MFALHTRVKFFLLIDSSKGCFSAWKRVTASAWLCLLGQGPHSKPWSSETFNTSSCLSECSDPFPLPSAVPSKRRRLAFFLLSPPSFAHRPQSIL